MTERDQEQALCNADQQEAKNSEILPIKECRASQNLQMTSSCRYVSACFASISWDSDEACILLLYIISSLFNQTNHIKGT